MKDPVKALHILFDNLIHTRLVLVLPVNPYLFTYYAKWVFICRKQVGDIALPQIVIKPVPGGDIQNTVYLVVDLPHIGVLVPGAPIL